VETIFDYVTLASFLVIAGAYLFLTTRELRILPQLVLAGGILAVANQLGNAGHVIVGTILIIAGIAYSVMIIRPQLKKYPPR
jgi:hypothetical protein